MLIIVYLHPDLPSLGHLLLLCVRLIVAAPWQLPLAQATFIYSVGTIMLQYIFMIPMLVPDSLATLRTRDILGLRPELYPSLVLVLRLIPALIFGLYSRVVAGRREGVLFKRDLLCVWICLFNENATNF